ncbi:MAG: hypothetical protein IJ747_03780 [Lachnospiraceae bacterium]|nr:hypothetical protein [Lachnospiraceae bacterium]
MKCFKKVVSLAAAAAIVLSGSAFATLRADAATPTTYYIKYDEDKSEWRMQIGNWDKEYEGTQLYYLNEGNDKVKDGDVVVILENDEGVQGHGDISINAHLSNLTVSRTSAVVAATGGIDNCYVLGESTAAISGNVTNGYVYDDAKCTFNNNVTNLSLIASQENDVDLDCSVKGTVAYCSVSNPGGIVKQYYSFAANTFYYDHASGLMTDPSNYSTSGSVPAASTATQTTTQTTTTASSQQSAGNASSGAYDDVPKTGDSNLAIYLFALSAISFAGCLAFRRKAASDNN